MRRTLDKIATANGGNQYTYVWLAIAWAKKKGHVPETLNRAKAGRDIPVWASVALWDLTGDDGGDWYRHLRLLLAGAQAASGTGETPVVDTDALSAARRLMNARKQRLALKDTVEVVNWMAGLGLVESPQRKARAVAVQPRTTSR